MRIIAGKYKGKKLIAPKNLPVRPTTDRAKESLFNILNNRFDYHSVKVIDLFSGTGNISYEFASRGTKNITAVEKSIHCIRYIKKTIKDLQIEHIIKPIKSDVFQFIKNKLPAHDIIFADPFYDSPPSSLGLIVNHVIKNNLLSDNGLLIIEHSTFTELSNHPCFTEKKKYGSVCFSFFMKNK